jgi:ketosteroid isomerase-like protein
MRISGADEQREEAKSAIEARSREFERRFAAHDAQGLVASYFVEDSEQPIASPPGGVVPLRGRTAIAAMFEQQFAVIRAIRLEAIQVESGADMAYELGRAHLALASGDNVKGRYTVLWRKARGEWRAQVDFFAQDGWQ